LAQSCGARHCGRERLNSSSRRTFGVWGHQRHDISSRERSNEVDFGDQRVCDVGLQSRRAAHGGEARIIANTIGRNDCPPDDHSSAAIAIA
jgi:hypothetical protein